MNYKPSNFKHRSTCGSERCHNRQFRLTGAIARLLLSGILAAACAGKAWAQGDMPSGTITSSGSGIYTYALTFSDSPTASSPIGSIWYGWLPFYNYLPGTPGTATAPTGWTALISGASIEFYASSSAYYIQPGSTLSGFSYTATFSPNDLANSYGAYSVAYHAGIESDSGATFSVQTVPEPSLAALFGIGALGLVTRWRKLR
jgi:hypothetical protein